MPVKKILKKVKLQIKPRKIPQLLPLKAKGTKWQLRISEKTHLRLLPYLKIL